MNNYRENLILISDENCNRLGFEGERIILDNRYFLGIRTSYDINIVINILDTSFFKILHTYEIKKNIQNNESEGDSDIDEISMIKYTVLELESIIEGALTGLQNLSKNNYYINNEHELFNNLYSKYNKSYMEIKSPPSPTSSLSPPLSPPPLSPPPPSPTLSSPPALTPHHVEEEDPDLSTPVQESYIDDSMENPTPVLSYPIRSSPSISYDNSYDERSVTQESPLESDITNVVMNPVFQMSYYNHEAIDIYDDEEVVYDKYNCSERECDSFCYKIYKKICCVCSTIKSAVHNAYKKIVSFFV